MQRFLLPRRCHARRKQAGSAGTNDYAELGIAGMVSLLLATRCGGFGAIVAWVVTGMIGITLLGFACAGVVHAWRSNLEGLFRRVGEWLVIAVIATPIAGIALGLTTGMWPGPQNGLSLLSPEAQVGLFPVTAIIVRALCNRILSSRRALIGAFRRFSPRSSRAVRRTLAPVLGAYGRVVLASDDDFQFIMLDSFLGIDPDRFADAGAQLQLEGAIWRAKISALIADLQIAVFDVTEWSSSLEWELLECARYLPPHCIVFVTAARGAHTEWQSSCAKLPATHAEVLGAALRRPLRYRRLGFRLRLFLRMRRVASPPPLSQAATPRLPRVVRWTLALLVAIDVSMLAADYAVRAERRQVCSRGDRCRRGAGIAAAAHLMRRGIPGRRGQRWPGCARR